jgi:hypothetical protein
MGPSKTLNNKNPKINNKIIHKTTNKNKINVLQNPVNKGRARPGVNNKIQNKNKINHHQGSVNKLKANPSKIQHKIKSQQEFIHLKNKNNTMFTNSNPRQVSVQQPTHNHHTHQNHQNHQNHQSHNNVNYAETSFLVPGTYEYTVPNRFRGSLVFTLCGGGGGGAGAVGDLTSCGGGGGSGAVCSGVLGYAQVRALAKNKTPLHVLVGAGGTGAVGATTLPGLNASAGQPSAIDGIVIAGGGNGGFAGITSSLGSGIGGTGGPGGIFTFYANCTVTKTSFGNGCNGGTAIINGFTGSPGQMGMIGSGGVGGTTPLVSGPGGYGGQQQGTFTGPVNGLDGTGLGAGGGGGAFTSLNVPGHGGNGAPGFVKILLIS